MSYYYMKEDCCRVKVYDDGRTKQSFKDETDVNRILAKFQTTGVISHIDKYAPEYGDFAEYDFHEVQGKLMRGHAMFAALPSEVRREFNQDPGAFFGFVNDPDNNERVNELLPGIANPGDYFVDVSSKTPPGELLNAGEPGEIVKVEVSNDDTSDAKEA